MHSTEISILTEADIADFLEAAAQERGDAEWRRLAEFAQDMLRNERSIWVARQDHDYVGMVTLRWQSDYAGFRRMPPAPEIVDLYVWQAKRRQGIASLLLAHIEDTLRAQQITRVGLGVGILPDDQPAQTLYRNHAYHVDGTGHWWRGTRISNPDEADHAIAPVLLMMDKIL